MPKKIKFQDRVSKIEYISAISDDQMIFSIDELKEKGYSHYKINRMVAQGILIKLNKKYYENTGYKLSLIHI